MNAKVANLIYVKYFYERGEAAALDTNITSQRLIETPVTKNWTVICHVYACYEYRFASISLICLWGLENVPTVMISVLVAFYFVHLTFWKGCRLHVILHSYSFFRTEHVDKMHVAEWKVKVVDLITLLLNIHFFLFDCRFWSFVIWINILHRAKV
jgi:hypothetical protein